VWSIDNTCYTWALLWCGSHIKCFYLYNVLWSLFASVATSRLVDVTSTEVLLTSNDSLSLSCVSDTSLVWLHQRRRINVRMVLLLQPAATASRFMFYGPRFPRVVGPVGRPHSQKTSGQSYLSSQTAIRFLYFFTCAHAASRYCFWRRLSASVGTKSQKLLVGNWCNLVGILTTVNR